ncbi:hypothetical protein EJA71_11925 [Pseudomonas sp. PB106]|nr:hypothetical protein EJA71_11925 [Pseudomonas sp. PB106]
MATGGWGEAADVGGGCFGSHGNETTFQAIRRSTCRSEPARDGGGSVNIDVECQAAIASRLTSTKA